MNYANRFDSSRYPKYTGKFFTNFEDNWVNELFYLNGVEQFCSRLEKAINNNDKICIYSDYDTDAVTATAVMYWGLIHLGVAPENLSFYAPDRFTEGYGMNEEAAIFLAKNYDLIISVDCGINSVKEAEHIKKAGKDLIITDHHQITGDLPICKAAINPQTFVKYGGVKKFKKYWEKHTDTKIDYKGLDFVKDISDEMFLTSSATGVGVAWFCILWLGYYLQNKGRQVDMRQINRLLPFVAIGTIADCQSIIEPTNRMMVKAGLKIFNSGETGFLGLEEMIKQTGLHEKMKQGYQISSQDLGYLFSPILNSSGRLSHAKLSIESMLAEDEKTAESKISELISTNNQRKQNVKDILAEVEDDAKKQFELGQKILWLQGDWSKGIIGLLASRLVNKYNLPVVVVGLKKDSDATASLRAPEGYNFPVAFNENPELFTKGGGHAQAAGFSATVENLKKIKSALSKSLPKQIQVKKTSTESYIPAEKVVPKNLIELETRKEYLWLDQNEIDPDLLEMIWKMEPFGIDFPFPELVFEVKTNKYKWLGDSQKHVKLFIDGGIELVIFNVEKDIFNNLNSFLDGSDKIQLWVSAKSSKNSWNGKTKNDLIVQKIWLIDKKI